MAKTLYVHCPFCQGTMEVDAATGEVLQKWTHEKSEEGSDKMSSALKKLEDAKKRRATLFDDKKGEMEDQKKKLEKDFKDGVERAKKEGVKEKPLRPFDLD